MWVSNNSGLRHPLPGTADRSDTARDMTLKYNNHLFLADHGVQERVRMIGEFVCAIDGGQLTTEYLQLACTLQVASSAA